MGVARQWFPSFLSSPLWFPQDSAQVQYRKTCRRIIVMLIWVQYNYYYYYFYWEFELEKVEYFNSSLWLSTCYLNVISIVASFRLKERVGKKRRKKTLNRNDATSSLSKVVVMKFCSECHVLIRGTSFRWDRSMQKHSPTCSMSEAFTNEYYIERRKNNKWDNLSNSSSDGSENYIYNYSQTQLVRLIICFLTRMCVYYSFAFRTWHNVDSTQQQSETSFPSELDEFIFKRVSALFGLNTEKKTH